MNSISRQSLEHISVSLISQSTVIVKKNDDNSPFLAVLASGEKTTYKDILTVYKDELRKVTKHGSDFPRLKQEFRQAAQQCEPPLTWFEKIGMALELSVRTPPV